jgi:parallel beta-helix repeat protein
VALAAVPAALCVAPTAAAETIVVERGESIQAAIDRASPGDTILVRPGTYREHLIVRKDDLTLKALRGRGSVLLVPPERVRSGPCAYYPGICVAGEYDEEGNPGRPVSGTRILGLTVARFPGAGIELANAADSTVSGTEARNNLHAGISAVEVSTIRLVNNVAHGNPGGGFRISFSPNATATVTGNQAYRNRDPRCFSCWWQTGDGFAFVESSRGVVRDNVAWGNCVGYAFVDAGDWEATGNESARNSVRCPQDLVPPQYWTYGVGFLLWGTERIVLSGNASTNNVGPTVRSGGIVLVSLGNEPTDNVIERNVSLENGPFDIRWDETGSGNSFAGNTCGTSEPSWICPGSG